MDYDTLVAAKTVEGSIKHWVNYGPAPASTIVTMAEDTIFASLRIQQMRALATGTIAIGASTISLPTGFREAISLKRTGDSAGPIDLLDIDHFEQRLALDTSSALFEGIPTAGVIEGNTTLRLNAQADIEYAYRLWHYASPARLSSANLTNFLTDRYSHMLLAACLYWAFSFMKDTAQRDHWFGIMTTAIDAANAESDLGHQSEVKAVHWNTR